MEAERPPRRLVWSQATVTGTTDETVSARTIVFDVPGWTSHRAGQHIDVRLTAPDGYQASRSYSLSSGPGEAPQITVERLPEGEVSPFMVDVVEIGDTFEVRGPIGGYFVYDPEPAPLLLIGGGSGITPLRSMWRCAPDPSLVTILYSARTSDRIIFKGELADYGGRVSIHLTRETESAYRSGRISKSDLRNALTDEAPPAVYVVGPTSFVETVVAELGPMLTDPRAIKTERFG